MSKVKQLHKEAMRLAQLALMSRSKGNITRAGVLALHGSLREEEAASLISLDAKSEPTRSILYRSAGSLAYQAKDYDRSLRLIANGLAGFPPPKIKDQLERLFDEVKFEKHLLKHKMLLNEDELELLLDGEAVSSGFILFREFDKRIKPVYDMISRTTQRLMKRKYQGRGRIAKKYQLFDPAMATGTGSFSIKVKLISLQNQVDFTCSTRQVFDEIQTGIELINSGNESELKNRIGDDSYYLNFLSLAQGIAPDGDKIKVVGFNSTIKSVSLARTGKEINLPSEDETSSTEGDAEKTHIEVKGTLDYADSRGEYKDKNEILGLTSDDDERYKVVIKEGMEDIVKSYYKQSIFITGVYDGKYIYPKNIRALDDE